MTASVWRTLRGGGTEQKGLTDNSVVIAVRVGIRILNGNGKNTIKIKNSNKMKIKSWVCHLQNLASKILEHLAVLICRELPK